MTLPAFTPIAYVAKRNGLEDDAIFDIAADAAETLIDLVERKRTVEPRNWTCIFGSHADANAFLDDLARIFVCFDRSDCHLRHVKAVDPVPVVDKLQPSLEPA